MTTGNEPTHSKPAPGRTRERLIEATLELIAEEGGSQSVNLRAVSRRVGCAHTNVYNYFDSYGELLWAAFREALQLYGRQLIAGLDVALPPEVYLRRTVRNLATFPEQNPGLYRFIGSDPIDLQAVPSDVMEMVGAMKRWFAAVVSAAAGPRVAEDKAREVADIVLAYVDGETLNLINGRVIAGEDLSGRVVANAMRLFDLLTRDASDGHERDHHAEPGLPMPSSIFGITEGAVG